MEEPIDVIERNDFLDEERENSEGDEQEKYDDPAGIDWSRLRRGCRRRPVSRTWHDGDDRSSKDDEAIVGLEKRNEESRRS